MTSDPIVVEQDGRVVTVTFNRPEARNAMSFEMYETLHDLCDTLDKDAGVRVMVLTGAGDKAFVSGTDIRQFLTFETKDDALGYEARITRVLSRIATMTKPTIAMVGGDAVGGGMFMSLACDLRIVAEHARFGAPVARTLGNFAAPFSLGLLAATVGAVRARDRADGATRRRGGRQGDRSRGRGPPGGRAPRACERAGRAYRGARAPDARCDKGSRAADDRRHVTGQPRGSPADVLYERGFQGRRARVPREAKGELAGSLAATPPFFGRSSAGSARWRRAR